MMENMELIHHSTFGLKVGFTVLRLVGFGVLHVVGFDPAKAQVGDIVVKITHNGCVSRVKMWVKLEDGASD
jgi:hypothetical protein